MAAKKTPTKKTPTKKRSRTNTKPYPCVVCKKKTTILVGPLKVPACPEHVDRYTTNEPPETKPKKETIPEEWKDLKIIDMRKMKGIMLEFPQTDGRSIFVDAGTLTVRNYPGDCIQIISDTPSGRYAYDLDPRWTRAMFLDYLVKSINKSGLLG